MLKDYIKTFQWNEYYRILKKTIQMLSTLNGSYLTRESPHTEIINFSVVCKFTYTTEMAFMHEQKSARSVCADNERLIVFN